MFFSFIKPALRLQPCFPSSTCSFGNSVLAAGHWLYLSLYCLSRDDLFRVELDNVAGDEMFYSKVSTNLDGHGSTPGFTVEAPFRNGPLIWRKTRCWVWFTETHMGVQQERYQDLQDEGQTRGEAAIFCLSGSHSKLSSVLHTCKLFPLWIHELLLHRSTARMLVMPC